MRVNQLLRHVDRMTCGVAQARQAFDLRQPVEKLRKACLPAVAIRTKIGVDVLADQRDLAHAGVDEAHGLGDDLGDGTRRFGAARIGHDAKRAELVAPFLHGDESRNAAGANLRATGRGQDAKFVLDGEIRVREPCAVFSLAQKLRQSVIALRTDDDIDGALALEHLFAFSLGDAAGDDDLHVAALRVQRAFGDRKLAEFGIDFFRGLFADMACVQDDEIGVFFALGLGVALAAEQVSHARRVIDVHLAAV